MYQIEYRTTQEFDRLESITRKLGHLTFADRHKNTQDPMNYHYYLISEENLSWLGCNIKSDNETYKSISIEDFEKMASKRIERLEKMEKMEKEEIEKTDITPQVFHVRVNNENELRSLFYFAQSNGYKWFCNNTIESVLGFVYFPLFVVVNTKTGELDWNKITSTAYPEFTFVEAFGKIHKVEPSISIDGKDVQFFDEYIKWSSYQIDNDTINVLNTIINTAISYGDYKPIIDFDEKEITYGCQTFSFDDIKRVYEKLKSV